jgi:hypothetical protein
MIPQPDFSPLFQDANLRLGPGALIMQICRIILTNHLIIHSANLQSGPGGIPGIPPAEKTPTFGSANLQTQNPVLPQDTAARLSAMASGNLP